MAQDHHYLPRSYQKRWADPSSGEVWVYQRPHEALRAKPKSTRATGHKAGLYTVFTSPTDFHDDLEDTYFREIDQKGSDVLDLIQDQSPAALAKLRTRRHDWERFVLALYHRNPRQIAWIIGEVINWQLVEFKALRENYEQMRTPDEPATWDEFVTYLTAGNMTPMAAEILRSFIDMPVVYEQFDAMDSGFFKLNNGRKLLTSDYPIIRHKGLKDPDGFIAVPVSPTEIWAAFNGRHVGNAIADGLNSGILVEEFNQYVVGHCIQYVYAADGDQVAFVDKHWPA